MSVFFQEGIMGCSFTNHTGDLHEMLTAKFHTSCMPPKETKPFTMNEEEEEVLKGSS